MSPSSDKAKPFGMVAEFPTAQATLAAARSLRQEEFERWDVFSPAPMEEIDELMPSRRAVYLTTVMFISAILGACLGYFVQWWNTVVDYPINVAGHPDNGWPGFIPSAWEACALFAVYGGFVGFLISCRLPRLYHPIFATPNFSRASQDRFFICVEAQDRRYDPQRLRDLFQRSGALTTTEIAA
jgi:hypothetical protein